MMIRELGHQHPNVPNVWEVVSLTSQGGTDCTRRTGVQIPPRTDGQHVDDGLED